MAAASHRGAAVVMMELPRTLSRDPVSRGRLSQLPDLRGAQFVDGLVDQVGALVVILVWKSAFT